MLLGAAAHEGSQPAGLDVLASVLGEVVRTFENEDIPYLLLGGLAGTLLGRPRCSSDIDLLLSPENAVAALEALDKQGFETEVTNPHWLCKAFKDDVLV